MATVFPLAFNNGDSWPGLQNPETAFIATLGRYQTHDSRPLLVQNVNPLWYPSRTEVSILLAEFKYVAQDGNGDFPCGGIYFWADFGKLQQNVRPEVVINPSPGLAVLNAAFAVASSTYKTSGSSAETSYGDAYYARARTMVRNPLDSIAVGDIVTLGLLAFYLMERNRRDSAYMYVSIALHILIMHGIHRRSIVGEHEKRVFWTIYILERWVQLISLRYI
jgi:hypothetical protein